MFQYFQKQFQNNDQKLTLCHYLTPNKVSVQHKQKESNYF